MPDRHRRAALLLPLPATIPGVVLLPRDRTSSSPSPDASDPSGAGGSGSSGSSGTPGPDDRDGSGRGQGSPDATPDKPAAPDHDNPFAPPPADAPDQEWRPRHQHAHSHHGDEGQGRAPGDEQPPSWGSQWSSKQPGRQGGGFGTRPGRSGQQGSGQGGPGGPGGGLRWDPTDPAQRRARYALLAGMWAFFFVLFSLPEVSLLLGALAIYWGISSLRAKPGSSAKAKAAATTAAMEGRPAPSAGPEAGRNPYGAPAPGGPAAQQSTRPQRTAAISGLVVAAVALMMVAATYTVHLAYRDYFTCVDDALTQSAAKSCEKLLPEKLRPLLSVQE
ncbi:hypothetical protein [Streptomyces pinistramenti]|uniref:hypothetical protein n=1 Tax=Streptomyces pinistramenti TaxID=2884812 RepID=UPI001D060E50|nr:hypothetical protein [Streptomyces pinistramenti]MCB5911757.1 hypothetical protein [Streptomyces pinistramenti]